MGKKLSRLCSKDQESLPVPPDDDEDCVLDDEPPVSYDDLPSSFIKHPPENSEDPSCIKQVTQYDFSPTIFGSNERKDCEQFLNYPILQDEQTIEYIQNSKVMVIMKGLPGSGKTHIIRRIKETYKDAVVCSADSYFMKDGQYKFNIEELKNAHESCQQKARKAAQIGCHLIIIDNTNIKAWESKYYLDLTKEYNYTPLFIEPQTPWAMDPKELVTRNSHGVPENILIRKLNEYEPVLPMYYWWYLNEEDSKKVSMMAWEWLMKAHHVQRFSQAFAEATKLASVEEMLDYYSKNTQFGGYNVLHATAKVTRGCKAPNAMEYIDSSLVRESLGKCFRLHIIGYVITPRTFGARLKLGENELELWGMDDNEIETNNTTLHTSNEGEKYSEYLEKSSEIAGVESDENFDSIQEGKLCHDTVIIVPSELKSNRFYPTSGKGSRAHFTLGCAPNIHAKTTGFDLMNVISCEQKVKESEKSGNTELSDQNVETYSIPEGVLKRYGDGIWVIYPEKEVAVSSMFSAFY